MKPFRLNPRQAAQQKRDLQTKDRLVLDACNAMNGVLKDGVEQVFKHWQETGRYKDPDLDAMDHVGEAFYRQIVKAAVKSSAAQDKVKKRLAKLPEGDLPEGARALERVLTNRRYWQKIMKRKRALIGRAKQAYLDKLRKQFKRLLPIFEIGDLSPREVKKKISEAWTATKPRTETIFRTEATRYFAQSQVAYFEDSSGIIGFLFDSVRDTSRTGWCTSRHGLIYRKDDHKQAKLLDENTPPCHWNCRSHLIPLVNDPENRKMKQDPNRDPLKVKVVALPDGWKS